MKINQTKLNHTSKISINKPKKTYQTLIIKLPKEWAEHLIHLEQTTSKSRNYYVREALYRYLEDLDDLQIGLERLKKKNKVYYTSEELSKRLGI